jgi:hypothetical protein
MPDGQRRKPPWTRAYSRTSSRRRSIINPATKNVTLWTLHDLRRTMASGTGELGMQPRIMETAINRQSSHKAGVAGTYNRANYHAERKQALEKWATHVMALVARPKGVATAGARPGAKLLKAAA